MDIIFSSFYFWFLCCLFLCFSLFNLVVIYLVCRCGCMCQEYMRWKSWLCKLQWLFRMLLPWGIQWGRLFLCRSIICNFCNNFQISQRSHKSQLKFIHVVTNFHADLSRHWRCFFLVFNSWKKVLLTSGSKMFLLAVFFLVDDTAAIWKTLAICAGLTDTKTRRWSKFLNWRKLNFMNWR